MGSFCAKVANDYNGSLIGFFWSIPMMIWFLAQVLKTKDTILLQKQISLVAWSRLWPLETAVLIQLNYSFVRCFCKQRVQTQHTKTGLSIFTTNGMVILFFLFFFLSRTVVFISDSTKVALNESQFNIILLMLILSLASVPITSSLV